MGTNELVDALITQAHLLPHALPVWHALDEKVRGRLFVGFDPRMNAEASKYGFDAHFGTPAPSDTPVLVASGNDLPGIQRAVLLEHGVGQTYAGGFDHICWAGGSGRENVVLFIVPNDNVRWANQARYPNTPCAVVGSPHVELLRKLPPYPLSDMRVAISSHWEINLVPELRSAFSWYEDEYRRLCEAAPDAFVMHGHPRYQQYTEWKAREWGVEFCSSFEELTQRAWLYVVDSSSTAYEWAALGRPVVHVNAPWYRTGVEHGLRFWRLADLGPQVFQPSELEAAIGLALADPSPVANRRRGIVEELFGADLSAGAAQRAADAIASAVVAVS